jgi:hypothetical protein
VVQAGDVGKAIVVVVLEAGAAKNISTASTKEIIVKSPDGQKKTFTASFSGSNGTDGKVVYTTASSADIDSGGSWDIQARIVMPGEQFKTATGKFTVGVNL